jgi:hypothetical protein
LGKGSSGICHWESNCGSQEIELWQSGKVWPVLGN